MNFSISVICELCIGSYYKHAICLFLEIILRFEYCMLWINILSIINIYLLFIIIIILLYLSFTTGTLKWWFYNLHEFIYVLVFSVLLVNLLLFL